MNFGNPSDKNAFMESLRNLDVTTCCKICTKFIKISKSCIIEARVFARIEHFLQSDPLLMNNIDELEVASQDIEERSENMDSSDKELISLKQYNRFSIDLIIIHHSNYNYPQLINPVIKY